MEDSLYKKSIDSKKPSIFPSDHVPRMKNAIKMGNNIHRENRFRPSNRLDSWQDKKNLYKRLVTFELELEMTNGVLN